MRTTFETRQFTFKPTLIGPPQVPNRIIMHRQGNLGAEGANGITWLNNADAGSIHSYIDDAICWDGVSPLRTALHVKAAAYAASRGYRTVNIAWGDVPRGDFDSIGIEMEDESPTSGDLAPGQKYGLSQETRITALLRCAAYMKQFNIPSSEVDEHATYDPAERSEDIGDGLYIPDFRLDLDDLLAGREPWRTVGRWARGTKNLGTPPVVTPAGLDAATRAALLVQVDDIYVALTALRNKIAGL